MQNLHLTELFVDVTEIWVWPFNTFAATKFLPFSHRNVSIEEKHFKNSIIREKSFVKNSSAKQHILP